VAVTALPLGTRVRNRTTDETATIVGLADSFGLVPVRYDDPPEGIYCVSAHRLEMIEGLTECRGDPLLDRRAA
jgi:hypothetical protein